MHHCPFLVNDLTGRYEVPRDHPTISRLVDPPADSYAVGRQNTNHSYISRRDNDYLYSSDSRRTEEKPYGGARGSYQDHYTVHRPADDYYRHGTEPPSNYSRYSRPVPSANVYVDRTRPPARPHARSGAVEINIAVSFGSDRTPRPSFATNNFTSKPPNIRSTATIDDVRYVDLSFQAPEHTAYLSTDGIMRQSQSQTSTGFSSQNAYQ